MVQSTLGTKNLKLFHECNALCVYVFVCKLAWNTEKCSKTTEELDRPSQGRETKTEPQGKHRTNSWKKQAQMWVWEPQVQHGVHADGVWKHRNATHITLPRTPHGGPAGRASHAPLESSVEEPSVSYGFSLWPAILGTCSTRDYLFIEVKKCN